jgi:acetolactate synthase-1/2/3 large subunit
VTRHEQVAGLMAAHLRAPASQGVLACASALPGANNLVTPPAFALLGGMPMMITGQKPILHSRQARFQFVDVVSLIRPLTKSAKQVLDAGNIPTLIRDAFRTEL